jgi:hypothetical protein
MNLFAVLKQDLKNRLNVEFINDKYVALLGGGALVLTQIEEKSDTRVRAKLTYKEGLIANCDLVYDRIGTCTVANVYSAEYDETVIEAIIKIMITE